MERDGIRYGELTAAPIGDYVIMGILMGTRRYTDGTMEAYFLNGSVVKMIRGGDSAKVFNPKGRYFMCKEDKIYTVEEGSPLWKVYQKCATV